MSEIPQAPAGKSQAPRTYRSLQTMAHTIKLVQPPVYKGEMDYEIIEAWIFAVDNYFALT